MSSLARQRRNSGSVLSLALVVVSLSAVQAFVPSGNSIIQRTPTLPVQSSSSTLPLNAAPKRLEDNVEGVVYVNDKCINCAACSNFAPSVFERAARDNAHIVHHQPLTAEEILDARAAMAACPVAAIRTETLAQRRHRLSDNAKHLAEESWSEHDEYLVQQMALSPKLNGLEMPFPRPLMHHEASAVDNNNNQQYQIYNVGHHNDRSFGATPYLVQAQVDSQTVWILVDSPRYSKSAVSAITQVTGPSGPDYMVLTHVDDTADHGKWAEEFPNVQRIFHAGDTGRHNWLRDETLNDVELLLPEPDRPSPPTSSHDDNNNNKPPFYAYSLNGTPLPDTWLQDFKANPDTNVVLLHTPGHSPGSITLWRKPHQNLPGVIFTGDHYAWTTRGGGQMTGLPLYGNNLQLQATTMRNLLQLDWDIVAPGHGHPRDYTQVDAKERDMVKEEEMNIAIANLKK